MQKILIKEMDVNEDRTKLKIEKVETKVNSHFKTCVFANTKNKHWKVFLFIMFKDISS